LVQVFFKYYSLLLTYDKLSNTVTIYKGSLLAKQYLPYVGE